MTDGNKTLNWDVTPSFTLAQPKKKFSVPSPMPSAKDLFFGKKQKASNSEAGTAYVCSVCGNYSQDIHGHTARFTWNKCCVYTHVRVLSSSIILDGDRVKYARSMRA